MENLQTDTLSDYNKNQETRDDTAVLLNVSDEIDELDNVSIASNSDVWKGSDSEEDETKETNKETVPEVETQQDKEKASSHEKESKEAYNAASSTDKESDKVVNKDLVNNVEQELPPVEKGPELANNEKESHLVDGEEKKSKQSSEVRVVNGTREKSDDEEVVINDDKDPLAVGDNKSEKDEEVDFDDEDFDPSLLCPEVSMDVDDNAVVASDNNIQNSRSVSPTEPFSSFVDEVTGVEVNFNLTEEEVELKKRMYGRGCAGIQYNRLHCTACNTHLGSALVGQNNRYVHPLLKVLICKECYNFYTSGDFEKDEDGSELYCRWCGQGGKVLCCSKCEFVFCQRCIQNNFGRRKMFEIRDSDSWDCFRCNQSQIITQRVACFEFFEYIRREMARAANVPNTELWSKDYSRCCTPRKRPSSEAREETTSKKSKKKVKDVDPDYDPSKEKVEQPTASLVFNPATASTPFNKPVIQMIPRLATLNKKDNDIEFVRQIPAPHVTMTATPRQVPFRAILPGQIRTVPNSALFRINQVPPLTPAPAATGRLLNAALQPRPPANNTIKHEWFEKTVRAAARVNSHLSYNLTQLNRMQANAASIEELAVVHNKLQEILSSSINSLIQIRKNLRTEFITGIKTVRLPSKKVMESSADDDVIFVSAPTPSTSKEPVIIIDKTAPTVYKSTTIRPVTLKNGGAVLPVQKGFLKVKTVKELQNVPSECITIPDDSPSTSKEEICNGAVEEEKEVVEDQVDPLAIPLKEQEDILVKQHALKEPEHKENEVEGNITCNESSSSDIKRMMCVKVNVQRDDLEKLQAELARKKL